MFFLLLQRLKYPALLMILAIASCAENSPSIGAINDADPATAAIVNGERIYLSDVTLEAVAQNRIRPTDTFGFDHPDFPPVLEQLIDQKLLAQATINRGLHTSAAAQNRLEAGRERILNNILIEDLVSRNVTEAAIDNMYAEQVRLQQLDDEVRLRHILVSDRARADQIYGEAVEGAGFSDLARTHSTDASTRSNGGSFGWVRPNTMVAPFPSVIGDTGTGNISPPFQSEQGWHIIKVDARRRPPPLSKDDMRDEIITFLTYDQISSTIGALRSSAIIDRRTSPAKPADTDNSTVSEDTATTIMRPTS